MNLVRGGLLMLVIGVLSFGMGFFVLSRLLGGGPKPENTGGTGIQVAASNGDNASRSAPTERNRIPAPSARTRTDTPPTTPKPAANVLGPSIDPAEESRVQQPSSLDTPQNSAAPDGAASDARALRLPATGFRFPSSRVTVSTPRA